MSATTDTAVSPAFDRERAPDALSGLTIVLPCFGEAENLPDAVRLATDAAERCAAAHEIVVVDDVGTELLVKSRAAGARVAEVPVHHRPRVAGRQVGSGPRLAAGTLRELADLRHALRGRRILRVGV